MSHADKAKELLQAALRRLPGPERCRDANECVDHIIAAAVEVMRDELQGRSNAPQATDSQGTTEASVGGVEAGVEGAEGEYERWEKEHDPAAYWSRQAGRWEKLHDARTEELRRTVTHYEEACENMREAEAELMNRLADAISLPSNDDLRGLYPRLIDKVCDHINRLEDGAYERMQSDQFGILARYKLAHAVGIPEDKVGEYSTMKLVELVLAKTEGAA